MNKSYSYPLDVSWSTEEISSVLSFFSQVEAVYEKGADVMTVLDEYKAFKEVVKSKGQERQLDRDFEAVSGYSLYQVVKAAREKGKGVLRFGN